MTVRESQGHLEELNQVAVAPDGISSVTGAVLAEMTAWQQRPLERVYPAQCPDAPQPVVREVERALGRRRGAPRDRSGANGSRACHPSSGLAPIVYLKAGDNYPDTVGDLL
jgi:hypothetical protein